MQCSILLFCVVAIATLHHQTSAAIIRDNGKSQKYLN